MSATPPPHRQEPQRNVRIMGLSEIGVLWLCYGLFMLAIFTGGITAIIALILCYLRRDEAKKGLEGPLTLSHTNWIISTFWRSLVVAAACFAGSTLLIISVVGFVLASAIWILLPGYIAYRLIKGMLALNNGRHIN